MKWWLFNFFNFSWPRLKGLSILSLNFSIDKIGHFSLLFRFSAMQGKRIGKSTLVWRRKLWCRLNLLSFTYVINLLSPNYIIREFKSQGEKNKRYTKQIYRTERNQPCQIPQETKPTPSIPRLIILIRPLHLRIQRNNPLSR